MKNGTLLRLEKIARELQRKWMQSDPEYAQYHERYENAYEQFKTRHSEDAALCWEVNDLLDAHAHRGDCRQELNFFLGLQMGMELGGLDLLRDPEQD